MSDFVTKLPTHGRVEKEASVKATSSHAQQRPNTVGNIKSAPGSNNNRKPQAATLASKAQTFETTSTCNAAVTKLPGMPQHGVHHKTTGGVVQHSTSQPKKANAKCAAKDSQKPVHAAPLSIIGDAMHVSHHQPVESANAPTPTLEVINSYRRNAFGDSELRASGLSSLSSTLDKLKADEARTKESVANIQRKSVALTSGRASRASNFACQDEEGDDSDLEFEQLFGESANLQNMRKSLAPVLRYLDESDRRYGMAGTSPDATSNQASLEEVASAPDVVEFTNTWSEDLKKKIEQAMQRHPDVVRFLVVDKYGNNLGLRINCNTLEFELTDVPQPEMFPLRIRCEDGELPSCGDMALADAILNADGPSDSTADDISPVGGLSQSSVKQVFDMYATKKTMSGEKLMTMANLNCFKKSMGKVGVACKMNLSGDKMAELYQEHIQMQVDLSARYNLRKFEASKGICFQTFLSVLNQVWHFHMDSQEIVSTLSMESGRAAAITCTNDDLTSSKKHDGD